MRRVKAWRLENLELSSADCFVLDMLAANIPHNIMDMVRNIHTYRGGGHPAKMLRGTSPHPPTLSL